MDRLKRKELSTPTLVAPAIGALAPPPAALEKREGQAVRRRLQVGTFLLPALLLVSASGLAQVFNGQPDETLPGFTSGSVFHSSGVDNVNVFSGDPGIVIPLGPSYTLSGGYTWQLKASN